MNESEHVNTGPKASVFVLMPFKDEFKHIYELGIKAAADDAGAHAKRLDDHLYNQDMLAEIINLISKADVVVADTTGHNPNVFYELGYAHALNKTVLLVASSTKDIPFDVNHFPFIIYDGDSGKLRKELATKLRWAISQSKENAGTATIPIPYIQIGDDRANLDVSEERVLFHTMPGDMDHLHIGVGFHNPSHDDSLPCSHAYISIEPTEDFWIEENTWQRVGLVVDEATQPNWVKFKLYSVIEELPSRASTNIHWLSVRKAGGLMSSIPAGLHRGAIALHFSGVGKIEFPFAISLCK